MKPFIQIIIILFLNVLYSKLPLIDGYQGISKNIISYSCGTCSVPGTLKTAEIIPCTVFGGCTSGTYFPLSTQYNNITNEYLLQRKTYTTTSSCTGNVIDEKNVTCGICNDFSGWDITLLCPKCLAPESYSTIYIPSNGVNVSLSYNQDISIYENYWFQALPYTFPCFKKDSTTLECVIGKNIFMPMSVATCKLIYKINSSENCTAPIDLKLYPIKFNNVSQVGIKVYVNFTTFYIGDINAVFSDPQLTVPINSFGNSYAFDIPENMNSVGFKIENGGYLLEQYSDFKWKPIISMMEMNVNKEIEINGSFFIGVVTVTCISKKTGIRTNLNIISNTKSFIECSMPINEKGDFYFVVSSLENQAESDLFLYTIEYKPRITSISSTIFGESSMVTISGEYFINDTLSVSIGLSPCNVTFISPDFNEIICLFSSNVGNPNDTLNVFIASQGLNTSADYFIYLEPTECLKGGDGSVCYGHGICNQIFQCDCNIGWTGYDCSKNISTLIPTIPIINNNSSVSFITLNNIIDIGIIQIREINFNNDIVSAVDFKDLKWNITTDPINTNQQKFNSYYNSTTFKLDIITNEENKDTDFNFYGDNLKLSPNSVKFKFEINNWNFKQSLNQLQVIFRSEVQYIDEYDNCGNLIEKSGSGNEFSSVGGSIRTMKLKVSSNQEISGMFSNRVIVDGRVLHSNVRELIESEYGDVIKSSLLSHSNQTFIVITMNAFSNSTIIDPTFSTLLHSADISNESLCDTTSKKWIIPVAVVVSLVGACILIICGVLLYKKHRNSNLVLNLKVKMNNLKN